MEQVLTIQNADEELIQQIREGSADAFSELVRKHQRLVRSFVVRHVGVLNDADELSQDVFIAAFRSIDRYQARGSVAAWLVGIARLRVLTHLRNKQKAQPISLEHAINAIQLQCLDDDVFESETEQQRLDALQSCIESLGSAHRNVVRSFYFEGDSAEEIGVRFNKPAGTIRMTLLRIRKSLRHCIAGKLADGESLK